MKHPLSRRVGEPVLDAHRSGSSADQLGVVEADELRPKGLWVRMRFGELILDTLAASLPAAPRD